MSEKKDTAIRLFGRRIQLGSNLDEDKAVASKIEPSTAVTARGDADRECTSSDENILCSKQSQNRADEKSSIGDKMDEEEPSSSSALEESKTVSMTENSKPLSNDKDSSSQYLSKIEDQSDQTSSTTHSQDQTQNPPKKPDKILPCPRCSSMDTKFCYFNNYNVNQPRHFCKNCQRYWTAGGTMRNVPVGAGRRKNKNSSSSQQHHLVIPDPRNGLLIHHGLRPNGTVLAFGSDSPLPESMTNSSLKLAETSPNCVPNGFYCTRYENSHHQLEKGGNGPPQMALSYTWNSIPWQSGLPVSFIAAPPYLACNNTSGTWNFPLLPTSSMCPAPDQSSTTCSPNSPIGKHPRDGTMLTPSYSNNKALNEEKTSENSRLVMPKTLRIGDPTEAAKSSIWETLGIKNNDKPVSSSNITLGGFFGGIQQSKDADNENGNQNAEGLPMVLQANPAAFSRSLSFHEGAQ